MCVCVCVCIYIRLTLRNNSDAPRVNPSRGPQAARPAWTRHYDGN